MADKLIVEAVIRDLVQDQNCVEKCDCKNENRFGNAKRHYMPRGLSHAGIIVDPLDQRTRVMSCTQFVSQVLPSSGEAACSQWHDVGVMLDQMKRARTRFPLTVSSP